MSQGTNKPDLSDLKARLGLKKPSAAQPTQGSQDSAQAVAERAPAAGGPRAFPPPAGVPSGPPGGAPAPAGVPSGPPVGAAPAGPPPGAAPAPRPAPAPAPAPQPREVSVEPAAPRVAPSNIVLDEEDLKAAGDATFSPMVLGLLGVVLVVGVGFGWAASSSLNNSSVYNAQTEDGARLHTALQPKIEEFNKAKAMVAQLSPDSPDFEAAEALSKFDFAVDSNLLGGGRLLLGPKLIGELTGYNVDSAMLTEMLVDHHNMTNNVDKKELELIQQNSEVLDKDQFAVLFDYRHLSTTSGSDDYSPRPGRLVTVTSLEKDEEGKVEVEFLNSSSTAKTLLQGLLPLQKSDILKSSGPDALQRYKQRVERIKVMTERVDNRVNPLMTDLKTLGDRPSAGLF